MLHEIFDQHSQIEKVYTDTHKKLNEQKTIRCKTNSSTLRSKYFFFFKSQNKWNTFNSSPPPRLVHFFICECLRFSGLWSFWNFLLFCYLANSWSNTPDFPETISTANPTAAIYFALFSTFAWVSINNGYRTIENVSTFFAVRSRILGMEQ